MAKNRSRLAAFAAAAIIALSGCTDISQSTGTAAPFNTSSPFQTSASQPYIDPAVSGGILLIGPDDTTVSPPTVIPGRKQPDIEAFHNTLEQIRTDNGVYGMGVALFKDGDIVYSDSLGYADIENETPCTKDTHFRAASVSKLISTILMMKLCDEGAITTDSVLDTAVGLPYSQYDSSPVKLWHLLTHTAGLTDTYIYEAGMTYRYSAEYVIENSHTGIIPGEVYNYSNFGAGTMGAVIEHLTGMFFHDYAAQALFEPLEMDAGYVIDLIDDKESCAVIYDHDGEIFHVSSWGRTRDYYESFGIGNSYLQAQCELLITPVDLARLGTALAGDGTIKECGGKRIISEGSLEKMHQSYINTEKFGMGLNVRRYDGDLVSGRVMYGHPGNALGAITGLFYDRDDHTGVVIMTNRCNFFMDDRSGLYRLDADVVHAAYEMFF